MQNIFTRVRHALGGFGRGAFGLAAIAAVGITTAATPAQAVPGPITNDHYVLTIDIANPSNVVISTTGEHSLAEAWGAASWQGVTLLSLFDTDFDVDENLPIASSNLRAIEDSASYSRAFVGFGSLSKRDVNLWGFGSNHYFTVEDAAFVGSMELDLDGALLTAGRVGDVITGDSALGQGSAGEGVVIGQYLVINSALTAIPSPTAATGGLLTMLLVGIGRHRRG